MKKSFVIIFGLYLGISTICIAQSKSVPETIIAFLKTNYNDTSENSRHFIYNAVDLNADGEDEYLVELIGSDWCGSGGCTLLVLDHNFKLNTKITIVNDPVYVGTSNNKETNIGYANIYIQNKDGSVAKMVWNGNKYPSNPSIEPKTDKKNIIGKFKFLNSTEQKQLKF
jgi:hypothetical protein